VKKMGKSNESRRRTATSSTLVTLMRTVRTWTTGNRRTRMVI